MPSYRLERERRDGEILGKVEMRSFEIVLIAVGEGAITSYGSKAQIRIMATGIRQCRAEFEVGIELGRENLGGTNGEVSNDQRWCYEEREPMWKNAKMAMLPKVHYSVYPWVRRYRSKL